MLKKKAAKKVTKKVTKKAVKKVVEEPVKEPEKDNTEVEELKAIIKERNKYIAHLERQLERRNATIKGN